MLRPLFLGNFIKGARYIRKRIVYNAIAHCLQNPNGRRSGKNGRRNRHVIPKRLELYLIRWQFKNCSDIRPCSTASMGKCLGSWKVNLPLNSSNDMLNRNGYRYGLSTCFTSLTGHFSA